MTSATTTAGRPSLYLGVTLGVSVIGFLLILVGIFTPGWQIVQYELRPGKFEIFRSLAYFYLCNQDDCEKVATAYASSGPFGLYRATASVASILALLTIVMVAVWLWKSRWGPVGVSMALKLGAVLASLVSGVFGIVAGATNIRRHSSDPGDIYGLISGFNRFQWKGTEKFPYSSTLELIGGGFMMCVSIALFIYIFFIRWHMTHDLGKKTSSPVVMAHENAYPIQYVEPGEATFHTQPRVVHGQYPVVTTEERRVDQAVKAQYFTGSTKPVHVEDGYYLTEFRQPLKNQRPVQYITGGAYYIKPYH